MSEALTEALPDVEGDIRKAIEKEISSYPVRSNWASKLGHPCERQAVHNRVDWDKKEKHSVTTEMIFQGGKVIEKYIARTYLIKADYDIVEEDRAIDTEGSGMLRRLMIGGKLDFVIRKTGTKKEYPVEVKSMNQFDWEKINCIEDMTLSTKVWQRAYPAQLMLYMIGKNYETGMFLLINKQTYEPKVIWAQIDWQYTENLLQKAGRVNAHVTAGTLPDRIDYDDKICGRCEYAHVCLEEWMRKEATILTDEAIEQRLDELETLQSAAKPTNDRIEELKEWRKEEFNGVEKAIAGKWMIVGKQMEGRTQVVKPHWKVSVKKIGGNNA